MQTRKLLVNASLNAVLASESTTGPGGSEFRKRAEMWVTECTRNPLPQVHNSTNGMRTQNATPECRTLNPYPECL